MADDPEPDETAAGPPAGPQPARQPVQLVLDLPHRTALGASDFLVGPSNAQAVEAIDRWPDWPTHALLLVGPAGAGKSHLVNVWRERSCGTIARARDLDDAAVAALARERALAIEDIDRCAAAPPGEATVERILFHLLNLTREQATSVLLTSRLPPGEIEARLPDLRSRLRAMPFVTLDPPDDALLSGLLVKLFSDRQLRIEPSVITFLLRHMERTTAMAYRVVSAVDERALATRRRVSRTLVSEVLADIEREPPAGAA